MLLCLFNKLPLYSRCIGNVKFIISQLIQGEIFYITAALYLLRVARHQYILIHSMQALCRLSVFAAAIYSDVAFVQDFSPPFFLSFFFLTKCRWIWWTFVIAIKHKRNWYTVAHDLFIAGWGCGSWRIRSGECIWHPPVCTYIYHNCDGGKVKPDLENAYICVFLKGKQRIFSLVIISQNGVKMDVKWIICCLY